MKKLLTFLLLPLCLAAGAQSLCLKTQCIATAARVGDTAAIGAQLTAANGYGSIVYKLLSGPNTPVIITPQASYTNTTIMQQNIGVTSLTQGTYIFQITGTDIKGGVVVGTDSIIVAAGCPVCPIPRVVASITIPVPAQTLTILGQTLTIPAQTITIPAASLPAGAIKYNDGSNQ